MIRDGAIAEATYNTNGCPASVAACFTLCRVVVHRKTDQAKQLTAADLILIMGGVPEGKEWCAQMAVDALNSALGGA